MFASTYDFITIERGYNYDYIIITGTIGFPIGFAAFILAGKWLKRGDNMKMAVKTGAIMWLSCIASYII